MFKKYYIANFNISMYVYDVMCMCNITKIIQWLNQSVIHEGRERTPEMSKKYIYGKSSIM